MAFLFDLIIYGFLVFDILIITGFLLGWIRIGRKSFTPIPITIFLFMSLAGSIVFYGSFIEPIKLTLTRLSWNEVAPEFASRIKGIKMALVGDFHLGPYKKKEWVEKVTRELETIEADMIVVLGDSIFEKYEPTDDFEPFQRLQPRLGKWAVLGNHDYGALLKEIRGEEGKKLAAKVKTALERGGITTLVNEYRILPDTTSGETFIVGGIDEIFTDRANIEKTFEGLNDSSPSPQPIRILLAHNPDIIISAVKFPIDLVLAAHTHAGQIRLPFWGSVPQIPTRLGNHYDQGLFMFPRFDGKSLPLVITRGLGESGPRARLLASPEILIIE